MPRGKQAVASKAPRHAATTTPKENAKVSKAAKAISKKRIPKTIKSKHPSIFQSVMLGKYDSVEVEKPSRDDPKNVLNRPTAKAMFYRQLHPQVQGKSAHDTGTGSIVLSTTDYECTQSALDKTEAVTRTDAQLVATEDGRSLNIFHRKLSRQLRNAIFRLVVVNDVHFVFPYSSTGKEQPDLAMTCRAIRKEALDLYYAENAFALELNATSMTVRRSMPSIERWLKTMAGAGWLQQIQHWVFSVEGLTRPVQAQALLEQTAEEVHTAIATPAPCMPRAVVETVIINFRWHRQSITDDKDGESTAVSPHLEVHCDVGCVLPVSAQRSGCAVQACPKWLNEIFINAIVHKRDTKLEFRAHKMMDMLKQLNKESDKILALGCDKLQDS